MSATLYTNPTISKTIGNLQTRSVKCRTHIMFNVLWSTFTNYTNMYIRAATRYQPDLNQTELDFRETAIDLGKNLDQTLQQSNLPHKISTRNESVFATLMTSLKQDNPTTFSQVGSRFNTRNLTAGLLLTLLLEEHITLLKRYIQAVMQGQGTQSSLRAELTQNANNIVKLYLKVSKWKGQDVHKNGEQVFGQYLADIVDHVAEESRKDYGSSNRVNTRLQNNSLCLADYFYKVTQGTDPYSLMDSGCSYNQGVVEFTEESDF